MMLIIATVCLSSSIYCSGGLPDAKVSTQIIESEGCEVVHNGNANAAVDLGKCTDPGTVVWRHDGVELARRQFDPRNRAGASTAGHVTVSAAI